MIDTVSQDAHLITAIQRGNYALARRLLTQKMHAATARCDHRQLAWCWGQLGKFAEEEKRIGDAVRSWSTALRHHEAAGDTFSADAERLRQLLLGWRRHREVFVSYARADEAIVHQVLRYVRRRQGTRFRVDTDFIAGKAIAGQIRQAIERCPTFLVFFSPRYVSRSWTTFELELYRDKFRRDREAHAEDCRLVLFCLAGWQRHGPVIEEFGSALHIDASESLVDAKRALARSLSERA